jgi:crotonobetainyl-CoA:carnitine CoA-transferase CaiB-like acyl-CoA transferase/Uma2 family endonuclease
VIKLEPPGGDPSRHFGPFPQDVPHPERSGLFLHLNRHKRSVVVDPASEAGAALIRSLAAEAHIVLEDYAPGSAAAWGWGWPTLHAVSPALVMTSITPFGQTGPYRDYRGSELTLQAIGGPLYTNGHQDREPLKLAGHYAHYHAGAVAALATLMALRRAEAMGAGDWIDVAVHECQAGCRDRQSTNLTIAAYTGLAVRRLSATEFRLGAGVRACRDGYVNIMGGSNRLPRLLHLIGRPDLSEHPQLMAPPGSVPDDLVAEVEGAYATWLKTMTKREAVVEAQAAGLLAGAVYTVAEVVQDPHYQVRQMWDTINHPATGPLRYPGRPFLFSRSPRRPPQRAPLLNEHVEAVQAGWPPQPHRSPTAGQDTPLGLPLTGLRVAEITVVWAGPHVTQLLAEWGADVIRVEPANKPQPYTRGLESVATRAQARTLVSKGIPTRLVANEAALDPWNRNASFNSHARHKRSMTCDIMTSEGHEALLRLLAHCDVLVENNVPETMDKAKLSWEDLYALNPRLILLRMPAFALDGPYRNYRAFGLHVEAMIGHTHLRGYPGESPELLSESLASDGLAGVQGAVAVLMALRHRDRTGEGQLIEMPLTEGFLPTLGEFIMEYTMNGRDTPTQGNRHRWHAPHNVYPCRGHDQWIAIDVGTEAEFAALCQVLGTLHLLDEPRFHTASARLAHVAALDQALATLTRAHDKEQLFHALQAAGVCAAPVRTAVEVLADPQLQARNFFVALPTADEQRLYRYPGCMFRLARTPNTLYAGPVRLGEHNREIYCDLLGYTPEQFAALEGKGLVGTAYPPRIWRPEPASCVHQSKEAKMAIATEAPTLAVTLHWPMSDEQFATLCALNPELRFEYTSTGDLIIMPPTGGDTGHSNANLTTDFTLWARRDGTGLIFDSSTLFILPNGAKRSPDVSWIRRERWQALTAEEQQGYPPLCPDFVLELRSPTDRLRTLQDKMREYCDNGARLGWLIDPLERVMYIYRPGAEVERLEAPVEVSGEPVLTEFVWRWEWLGQALP